MLIKGDDGLVTIKIEDLIKKLESWKNKGVEIIEIDAILDEHYLQDIEIKKLDLKTWKIENGEIKLK